MKKWQEVGFTRNTIISKTKKAFHQKFVAAMLKWVYKLSQLFDFLSSELIEKSPLKEREGRVGPGRAGSPRLSNIYYKNIFWFHRTYQKNQKYPSYRVVLKTCMILGKKLSTASSLRFSRYN